MKRSSGPTGDSSSSKKALEYAFLLLKYRLRSEKELVERLRRKKFSEALVKQTLDFLKEKKFVDDRAFARAWVASRLGRPLGVRRLSQELRLKGIAKRDIDEAVEEQARQGYDEAQTLRDIVAARLARLKGLDAATVKNRLYAYLARRGYSPEAIIDELSRIRDDHDDS